LELRQWQTTHDRLLLLEPIRSALKFFGCGLTLMPIFAEWHVRQTFPSGWHDWHDARFRRASAACWSGNAAMYACVPPDFAWSLIVSEVTFSRPWQFAQNCGSWHREHCCGLDDAWIGWIDTQSLRWLSGLMSRFRWLSDSFADIPPPL
jgi:hypothetical protein